MSNAAKKTVELTAAFRNNGALLISCESRDGTYESALELARDVVANAQLATGEHLYLLESKNFFSTNYAKGWIFYFLA